MENFRKGSDCETFYAAKGVLKFCPLASYIDFDKKQKASGSTTISEEEKLQFRDEIRKQVECGENKDDCWKKTIVWRAFQFSPIVPKIVKYLV